MRYLPESGTLELKGTVPLKESNGGLLLKTLEVVLNDPQIGSMIQRLDLS